MDLRESIGLIYVFFLLRFPSYASRHQPFLIKINAAGLKSTWSVTWRVHLRCVRFLLLYKRFRRCFLCGDPDQRPRLMCCYIFWTNHGLHLRLVFSWCNLDHIIVRKEQWHPLFFYLSVEKHFFDEIVENFVDMNVILVPFYIKAISRGAIMTSSNLNMRQKTLLAMLLPFLFLSNVNTIATESFRFFFFSFSVLCWNKSCGCRN